MHHERVASLIETLDDQLKWHWGTLSHLAEPLVADAKERELESIPIVLLAFSSEPPDTQNRREEILAGASSAIAVLKRVAEANPSPDKRLLVALIHRFLHEVSTYFGCDFQITIHQKNFQSKPMTPVQFQEVLTRFPLHVEPSSEYLQRLTELTGQKGEARNALEKTGNRLAQELVSRP